jgi:DNA processing protein
LNHNAVQKMHSTVHQAAQGDNMVNTPEELGAWLRLVLTPGVGPESARRLLAAFGEPQALFAQTETALCQVVNAKQAQALRLMPDGCADLTRDTLDWLQAANGPGRCVITLGDADYPAPLLDIPDPPLMLYALGQTAQLATLRAQQALAMVGSRNPTPQGAENARAFACSLAASGLTVVSGLALGVDGAAHEGALQGGLQSGFQAGATGRLATIAVVGTGLDRVYPRQHRDLAHRVTQNGLILSEYPLGTPPLSPNFPRRNRLISGLSQATLVVEAALQSGSLITAKQALEQGRDVMAIPGSIHSAQAKGCHALIKQGAKLVESVQDVLEELRMPNALAQMPLALAAGDEDAPDDELLRALGHDPVSLDALQARCGWTTARLQAQLLELELMGQVGRLPGGLFQRMGSA